MLVVATPCPLILATPVAIIGGINRAARQGIIFRHGGALEQLGQVNVAVFDKTGTITVGHPEVAQVVSAPPLSAGELLGLAAGVEQGSGHPLARMVVAAARAHGLVPPEPVDIVEAPGQGVSGIVRGREVAVGGRAYLAARYPGIDGDLRALRGSDVPGYNDSDSALLSLHRLLAPLTRRIWRSAELVIANSRGLRDLAREFAPETVAARCDIAAADIRRLARELAAAPSAAVYGRIGTCTQAFGTLTSWLVDVVNVLTGFKDELIPWLADHMDVNAIDATGAAPDQALRIQEGAVHNVKRVVLPGANGPVQSPYRIAAFTETKTVWHPKGL